MKGIGTTSYDFYLERVLGGKEDLKAANELLGDTVFEKILTNDDNFVTAVDGLVDSAMAAGMRRSAKKQGIKGFTWQRALSKVAAASRHDPNFYQAMRSLAAQSLQQIVAFQRAGRQTYRFAPALSERLIRTNIDVPARLFKLPHKAFQTVHESREAIDVFCGALSLLRPSSQLPEGSAYGGNVSIMMLMVDQGLTGKPELLMEFMLLLPPGGKNSSRSLAITLQISPEADDRLPDLISHRSISVPDEYEDPNTDDMDLFEERVSALLRLGTNSSLYLISTNADVGEEKNPYEELKRKSTALGLPAKQRKRAERELLSTSSIKFREAGRSLKPLNFQKEASPQSGRRLTKRFVVSGHWKVQRFGPKRSESKIIFVEPYTKGPEAADIVAGNYLVPDKNRKIVDED